MKQILKRDFLIFSTVTLVAWIAFAFLMRMPVFRHDILADQHTRQALAWREGRMHLEENVGWLAMLFSFFIFEKLTKNRLLSFLMSFSLFWGSQILYLSVSAQVWHQGQLYGVFFAILALLVALLG